MYSLRKGMGRKGSGFENERNFPNGPHITFVEVGIDDDVGKKTKSYSV